MQGYGWTDVAFYPGAGEEPAYPKPDNVDIWWCLLAGIWSRQCPLVFTHGCSYDGRLYPVGSEQRFALDFRYAFPQDDVSNAAQTYIYSVDPNKMGWEEVSNTMDAQDALDIVTVALAESEADVSQVTLFALALVASGCVSLHDSTNAKRL